MTKDYRLKEKAILFSVHYGDLQVLTVGSVGRDFLPVTSRLTYLI